VKSRSAPPLVRVAVVVSLFGFLRVPES
jgi:hypothetical protein